MVPDHLLVQEALAVVPGFRGSVHRVPELEALRMIIPQFLQLRPQQEVLLSLVGKAQVAHRVIIRVFHDGADHLQHWGDARSSRKHAHRLHCLDDRVGFLVRTDGKLSFALVDQQPIWASELNGASNLHALQVLGHLPSSGKLGVGVFEVNLDGQVHKALVITGDGRVGPNDQVPIDSSREVDVLALRGGPGCAGVTVEQSGTFRCQG